jgi:AraC-like DNA-binding protein
VRSGRPFLAWAGRAEAREGLLAALTDPRLADALAAIHAEPARPWTLASLSRRAAMGRTAFAQRFRAVMGDTPLRYLTQWRMQHATRLLAESDLTLARIAERVGYDSAASLSRAFRKASGSAPGAYRRAARAGRAAPSA